MKIFSKVVIFVLGAGVGSAATYFLMKDQLEKEAAEQIEETRNYYRNKELSNIVTADKNNGAFHEGPFTKAEMEVAPGHEDKNYNTIVKKYATPIGDIPSIIKPFKAAIDIPEEDLDDEIGDDIDVFIKPSFEYPEPYVISEEEFSEEFLHHDKLNAQYYTDDDTFCDDKEETIDDVLGILGEEAYLAIQENGVVYVRNEQISVDYEITRIKNSYAKLILGYDDRPKRKSGRPRKEVREEDGAED